MRDIFRARILVWLRGERTEKGYDVDKGSRVWVWMRPVKMRPRKRWLGGQDDRGREVVVKYRRWVALAEEKVDTVGRLRRWKAEVPDPRPDSRLLLV